jgi:hypothetical protein
MSKTKVAGGLLTNGAFLPNLARTPYGAAHNNFARSGSRAKRLDTPAPVIGQRRATTGTQSAFHHGVAVQDEPLTTKLTGRSVPIHNGMRTETPEYRGADYGQDHGARILSDAGPGSWRSEVGGKHGDIIDKAACLPPSPKR